MARGKTEYVNLMIFSRDAKDLEVDVFHIMACYLITQGGGTEISDEHKFFFRLLQIYTRGEHR